MDVASAMNAGTWPAARRGAWSLAAPALLVAFLAAMSPARADAVARLDGSWIVVTGRGNTLETIARDVGDPAVFSFDPETGYAVSGRSLRVEGELVIGGQGEQGRWLRYVNSLEFDIGRCGQARIELAPSEKGSPRMVIENARIAALDVDRGNDACQSEGNLVVIRGGAFAMRRSSMSGNFVIRVVAGRAEIVDSVISTSNHTGLAVAGIEGGRLRLAGVRLLDHRIYGMEVGPCDGRVVLERCTIRGGGADLLVRGQTQVVARDCDFDSIRFAGGGGSVRRQWTVKVFTPRAGCRVVAESESGTGLAERIESVAGADGAARLVLTEYTARAGGRGFLERGRNDSTPHRITVYSPGGGRVLGVLRNYRVFAHGQEVAIP